MKAPKEAVTSNAENVPLCLQLINQTVLSNRRAYADLYARLMMSDIEREKRLHTQWTKRVEDWKSLHIDKTCDDFRSVYAKVPPH